MFVMTTDHASGPFNAHRIVADSFLLPPAVLDPVQFLVRWPSHLCAPTSLLLAGSSLALSTERRVERGGGARGGSSDPPAPHGQRLKLLRSAVDAKPSVPSSAPTLSAVIR